MRMKLGILLTGAALMLVVFGCSADKLTEPNPQQVRLRPVSILQEPGIGDLVWMDANMNGIQDDPAEEPGLANIAVQLLSCDDSTVVATDTTDTNGLYGFEDLTPGSYFLHFALPEGYAFSPMNIGVNDTIDSDADTLTGFTTCITIDTGEVDLNWDAGMYMITGGCTYSKGYWKNHAGFGPQADVVTPFLPIWLGDDGGAMSMAVTDAQTAVNVLQQKTYGDPSNGITKLYAQLLAAKLNIANGAGMVDIADVVSDADAFLAAHDWMDWGNLEMTQKHEVLSWKDMLDDYNNGIIGPGYCGDEEDHDGDDSDGDMGDSVIINAVPSGDLSGY